MKRVPRPHPDRGHAAKADPTAALAAMRDQLRAAAEAEAQARAQAAAAQLEGERAQQTFRAALGEVTPLKQAAKVPLSRPRRPQGPAAQSAPAAPLGAALSDGPPALGTLDEDGPSWQAPGVGPDVVKRLARGDWPLEASLDLHGLTTAQARDALAAFVHDCHTRGARCVRIVHGKGLGSVQQVPVLKAKVPVWLSQLRTVMAFCQASAQQGGRGATLVLLTAAPRRS